MNEETVNQAFAEEAEVAEALFKASEQTPLARENLKTAEHYLIDKGLVEGSNEKARAANLARKLEDEGDAVAEREERHRKLDLDLARLETARVRNIIRLLSPRT